MTKDQPKLSERELIIANLYTFIKQKPGMEPGNYDSYASYRGELRQVTNDRHHAERLLGAIAWRTGITAEHLKDAMKRAFSGRLEWIPAGTVKDHGGSHASVSPHGRLEYTTGQYFATEYRRAVAAVCASALWNYWRDGYCDREGAQPGETVRRDLIKSARQEFGATIANRYFN